MPAGSSLGGELPVVSGVTGTTRLATGGPYSQYVEPVGYSGAATMDNTGLGYASGVTTGSTMMGPAIQTIWSKEILFQSLARCLASRSTSCATTTFPYLRVRCWKAFA
jgi:hypothetical protein